MNLSILIHENESLKKHSTLKIGGAADYFSEPHSELEIAELLTFAKNSNFPYLVMGHGSNLLFDDQGFHGIVIKLSQNFSRIVIKDDIIVAQAGAWVPCVARVSQTYGLSGLEHTVGIPGSIGGLVAMNGGSLRKCVGDNVVKVKALSPKGEIVEFSADQCGFGYRESVFQRNGFVILEVTLKLNFGDKSRIRYEMCKILKNRRNKFPRKNPNCGSVFKSSPELFNKYGPPGKVIEDLGLKGMSIGDVRISDVHANFFINIGNASSSDFLKLVTFVKRAVLEATRFDIETEVKCIASDSNR